jgi:hypothetical protein
MDPTMQQFFAAQTQLLQNLNATVQNLQAQQNQPAPLSGTATRVP